MDFSNPQESYPSSHLLFILYYINKSCYSTTWTSPTHKSHIHPAIFYLFYFILINNVIQQNGLLQPARVISILPREDFAYFLMGMFYWFYFILINHGIEAEIWTRYSTPNAVTLCRKRMLQFVLSRYRVWFIPPGYEYKWDINTVSLTCLCPVDIKSQWYIFTRSEERSHLWISKFRSRIE
jgi:hypothetical protein